VPHNGSGVTKTVNAFTIPSSHPHSTSQDNCDFNLAFERWALREETRILTTAMSRRTGDVAPNEDAEHEDEIQYGSVGLTREELDKE
jgi:hypothetical protein